MDLRQDPVRHSRMEDKPGAAPAEPAEPLANVKITESGDTVTFERPESVRRP